MFRVDGKLTVRTRSLGMFAIVAAAAFLLPGCQRKDASSSAAKKTSAGPPLIYTTFYPTTYFTQRIAGDLVKVVNPCPADADPAFWMPDEQTIGKYQSADLIVVNGASFEKWVIKATLPSSRIVDTTKPFESEFIVIKNAITHSHGPSGKHTHEGTDGHTWLDPINAKTQAGEILHALVKLRQDNKAQFEQGYADLVKDLDTLDARLKTLAGKIGDQLLLCSHPAYNYVGRRYGWNLKNFHLDPEEKTDEQTVAEIKAYLADHPARFMLWEAEPSEENAAIMTGMGLTNVVYSPCESLDADQLAAGVDFLKVMNENIDHLEQALTPATGDDKPTTSDDKPATGDDKP